MEDITETRRLRVNLQGEIDSATVYEALADAEQDEKLSTVYRRLAAVERAHSEFWAGRLKQRGDHGAPPRPSFRARSLAWLGRRFGPGFVLPALAGAETRDSSQYDNQADAAAAGLPGDERSHARIVQTIAERAGGLPGQTLAQLEGRHRGGGGNALRAAVLGANDGLVSNLSLVMGVSGAASGGRAVLLAGLAGLVAGACSMGMGEWLSVNSSRELSRRQIDIEAAELEQSPQMEKEELVLIYQAKGLDERAARTLADKLFQSRDAALDTLAREELGVDPEGLGGSAWAAAAASFCLFSAGAIFPVAPFFVTSGPAAVIASLALSGLALGSIGAATSLFTGRSLLFSAGRALMIGYGAAAITFGVGRLLGAAVS